MSDPKRAHNPHDNLVRYVFSRPEAVAIILRRVVNPALLPFIDFASLRALPTVHSGPMLHRRDGDLRFAVDLIDEGIRIPLYLVLEHQSTYQPQLPCRAHVYIGDMWAQYIREHPNLDTVPAILPILLAQYPARATPCQLTQIFALTPKLRGLIGPTVELEIRVDDLSGSVLDDPMANPITLALVEISRALLHAYRSQSALTPERMSRLAPQFDILLEQQAPLGKDDVGALWRYVITVFEPDSPLRDLIVESVSRKAKQMYATIADQLHAEGHTAGHAAGLAAGLAAALLGVFQHRALPIPEPIRERVLATRDERQLQRWFDRAFNVTSADELFEVPDS
jgi:hypothetical protein